MKALFQRYFLQHYQLAPKSSVLLNQLLEQTHAGKSTSGGNKNTTNIFSVRYLIYSLKY